MVWSSWDGNRWYVRVVRMDLKGGCCLDKLRGRVDVLKRDIYKRNCRIWNLYNVFK